MEDTRLAVVRLWSAVRSCRTVLADMRSVTVQLSPDVRSCAAAPERVPLAGGAAVAGETFLPDRDEGSAGRWVLRDAGPSALDLTVSGTGAAAVFAAPSGFLRRVERVSPCPGGVSRTVGPLVRDRRGTAEGGVFGADVPLPMVAAVCTVVWFRLSAVLLSTV